MFSPQGLFRSVACPEGESCSRLFCLFSHDPNASSGLPPLEIPSPIRPEAPSSSIPHSLVPTKRTSAATFTSFRSTGINDAVSVDEPPKKLLKTGSAPADGQRKAKVALKGDSSIRDDQPPILKVNPASSKVAIPVRQTMLDTLFNQFTQLYASILGLYPDLAREHSLAQERDIYEESSQAAYRNAVISVVAKLKKRPKPDSISHTSVGTEDEVIKRQVAIKSLETFRVTSELLEPFLLTSAQEKVLGYVTQVPPGPGGDRPSHEGQEYSECDRCRKPFLVHADTDAIDCIHHWGKAFHIRVPGEKEKKKVFTCCSQSVDTDGCSKGPHVFYEKQPEDLHARFPFTLTASENNDVLDVVALDCEMIYTTAGLRLARVSIVDGAGDLVLDEVVKLEEGVKVIDYNTRFSGITSLESARLDLHAIKLALSSSIGTSTIVIGHALENDLKALRIVHRRYIDTSVLFPHKAGLPYRRSLRDLAREKLGRSIQQGGGVVGHSSLEDARATLDLVRWYVLHREKER